LRGRKDAVGKCAKLAPIALEMARGVRRRD
jgi:hypothetical protein